MKKRYYSLFAAAAMLLATSCSQEEEMVQQSNGLATFSVSLNGATSARAAGDGQTVDKLYYEVYEGQTKISGEAYDKVVDMSAGEATVEIPLMKGHTYTIAFWAQNSEADIYDAEDLTAIGVNYTNATANNEKYDAFYKAINYQVKSTPTTVELTRPFAQLNVGTTTTDWEAAKNLLQGNDPTDQSIVTVAGLANSFNVFKGEATGNVDVNFAAAGFIGENFTLDNVEYKNLAMNYLLVPGGDATEAKATTTVGVTFQKGGNDVHSFEVLYVPVERNYRTNIVGNLFTEEGDFEVIVKPGFNEPAILYPELLLAAANGGTVTLEEDVELKSSLTVAAGKSMTINLNGHDIITNTSTGNYGEDEAIVVYGELTIEGEGTVESNSMAVWARGNEGAVINIYGGTYKGLSQELAKSGRSVVYASSGNTINIYGGTFEAKAADMTSFADKTGVYAALNIADNNGNINVYGGTFKNFNPAIPGTEPKSWNDNHPNGFVADGYVSTKIAENTYCVTKGVSTPEEFKDALENVQDGDVIALNSDVNLSETIIFDGIDAIIDLNGYSINATENQNRPFELTNGANLTINAEGTEIDCGKFGLVNMTEGTLTINGGTFVNDNGNNGSFIKVDGEEEMVINLNNVTYKAGTTDSGVLRSLGSNVTVNIEGGEYEAGMGFIIPNGSVKNATISATNTANMWPAVYAAGENVSVEGCTIKSACHAIAVAGGETVTVKNCDVQVPDGKLAFQVFSSGGTINVIDCTWTGSYGTTGKMSAGCTAIINIDGVEKYRKTAN